MEAILFEDFLVSEMLGHHVQTRDANDWNGLLGVVDNLFNDMKVKSLAKRGKFAYGMIIVGSQHLDRYLSVFESLQDWGHLGGCYWICAEELFRHHILYTLQTTIDRSQENNVWENLCKTKVDNFPSTMDWIPNLMLRERLKRLSTEIDQLINTFKNNSKKQIQNQFQCYRDATPLMKFVPWYLHWASKRLRIQQSTYDNQGQQSAAVKDDQAHKRVYWRDMLEGRKLITPMENIHIPSTKHARIEGAVSPIPFATPPKTKKEIAATKEMEKLESTSKICSSTNSKDHLINSISPDYSLCDHDPIQLNDCFEVEIQPSNQFAMNSTNRRLTTEPKENSVEKKEIMQTVSGTLGDWENIVEFDIRGIREPITPSSPYLAANNCSSATIEESKLYSESQDSRSISEPDAGSILDKVESFVLNFFESLA